MAPCAMTRCEFCDRGIEVGLWALGDQDQDCPRSPDRVCHSRELRILREEAHARTQH